MQRFPRAPPRKHAKGGIAAALFSGFGITAHAAALRAAARGARRAAIFVAAAKRVLAAVIALVEADAFVSVAAEPTAGTAAAATAAARFGICAITARFIGIGARALRIPRASA